MKENTPILKTGTYGTHIMINPAGTFSFVGTVPEELYSKIFTTYDDALEAFVYFFKNQPKEFQKEYISSLRNDVFVKVSES